MLGFTHCQISFFHFDNLLSGRVLLLLSIGIATRAMFPNVCSLVVFLFLNIEISSRNVADRSNNNAESDRSALHLRKSIEKLQKIKMTYFSSKCPFTEHWEIIGDPCPETHEPLASAIYVRRIARLSAESGQQIKLGYECYVRIESRKCQLRLRQKPEKRYTADGITEVVGAENFPPSVRSKRQAYKKNEVVGYFKNHDVNDYGAQEQDIESSTLSAASDTSSAVQDLLEATSADTIETETETTAPSGDEVTAEPAATPDERPSAADDTKEEPGGDDVGVVVPETVQTLPPTRPAEIDEVEKMGDDDGRATTKPAGSGRFRRTSIIFTIVGILLAIVLLISATILLIVVRRRKRRKLQASVAARSASAKK